MTTIASPGYNGHPVLPDIGRPHMAKAGVRKPDIDWNLKLGQAIQRAVAIVGWSNKEAADVLKVDDAEFGKWVNGTRRPHFDKLFDQDVLFWPLIQCLAQTREGVEVVTTIRRIA